MEVSDKIFRKAYVQSKFEEAGINIPELDLATITTVWPGVQDGKRDAQKIDIHFQEIEIWDKIKTKLQLGGNPHKIVLGPDPKPKERGYRGNQPIMSPVLPPQLEYQKWFPESKFPENRTVLKTSTGFRGGQASSVEQQYSCPRRPREDVSMMSTDLNPEPILF